jgi:hypothetical protein
MTCKSCRVCIIVCDIGGKSSVGNEARGWGSKVDNESRCIRCVGGAIPELTAAGLQYKLSHLLALHRLIAHRCSLTTMRSCVGSMVRSAISNLSLCAFVSTGARSKSGSKLEGRGTSLIPRGYQQNHISITARLRSAILTFESSISENSSHIKNIPSCNSYTPALPPTFTTRLCA